MYYYTQSDKNDKTSFNKFASFFIDKFPLACGGTANYTNDKGVTSETKNIKVEYATKVEYEFDEEEHA